MKNYLTGDDGNRGNNFKKVGDGRIVSVAGSDNLEKTISWFMKRSGKIQKEKKEKDFHMTAREGTGEKSTTKKCGKKPQEGFQIAIAIVKTKREAGDLQRSPALFFSSPFQ